MVPAVPPVNAATIARAVDALAHGGLVAMPTETVYGLAADAENEAAVRAIFAAKGRPADHPVIVHVAADRAPEAALDAWGIEVPEFARTLARAFWPGPLTLIVKRSARALDVITGGQNTVGLRCPAHPWAQALLSAYAARTGHALAAPSANTFGRISPTTAAHVREDLDEKPAGRVDVILDGGPCPVGIESTIVDCSGAAPRLLRSGAVTRAQLAAALGGEVQDATPDAPRASGGLASHYAPRTPLEIVDSAAFTARMLALRAVPLALMAPADIASPLPVERRVIAPDAPADYARVLYSALHELDAAGAARILIVRPPAGAAWEAIHDRLNRAAAGGGVEPFEPMDC
jgi:L-threonylcarbamoyladenylate synthase